MSEDASGFLHDTVCYGKNRRYVITIIITGAKITWYPEEFYLFTEIFLFSKLYDRWIVLLFIADL